MQPPRRPDATTSLNSWLLGLASVAARRRRGRPNAGLPPVGRLVGSTTHIVKRHDEVSVQEILLRRIGDLTTAPGRLLRRDLLPPLAPPVAADQDPQVRVPAVRQLGVRVEVE